MATLGWCRACGHRVSNEARACPQCGQPNPYVHVEIDSVYESRVAELTDSGAFVELSSGPRAFLHVSQISRAERVKSVAAKLRVGDTVRVKVIALDDHGRILVSMKAAR